MKVRKIETKHLIKALYLLGLLYILSRGIYYFFSELTKDVPELLENMDVETAKVLLIGVLFVGVLVRLLVHFFLQRAGWNVRVLAMLLCLILGVAGFVMVGEFTTGAFLLMWSISFYFVSAYTNL